MALTYYQKAVEIQEKIQAKPEIGFSYNGIGNIYLAKKDYNKALVYYLKAFEILDLQEDKQSASEVCNGIGKAYLGLNKIEEALFYQFKSYNLCKQIGFKYGMADAIGEVGKLYETKNNYQTALLYYNEMLILAKELNYKEGIRLSYAHHASVYRKLKDCNNALLYTDLYNEIKDSLLNKENFKQIAELNIHYETESKEKEILLLTKDQQLKSQTIKQQQVIRWGLTGGVVLLLLTIIGIFKRYRFKQKANTELIKTQDELYKVIEQKEKLTSILAHDLKTPLRFMASVSAHLDENIDTLTPEKLSIIAKELSTTSKNTFAFAQELLTWLSMQKKNFRVVFNEVDVKATLEELYAFFQDIAKMQETELLLEPMTPFSVQTDHRLLKIILRNIIDNAIKNTSNGTVKISTSTATNGILEIFIEDNGNGMTKEQLEMIETENNFGFQFEIKEKLGIQIIKDLASKINSKIKVKSQLGIGTVVSVQLPLKTNHKKL
jgi:signal transduction histidine kinase